MKRRIQPVEEPREVLRPAIAGAVLGLALIGLLFGGPVIKIVTIVMALTLLQGLWRGATELGGIVLGLLLAVLLAPMLGRSLEGTVAAASGSGGLMARWVAMGVAAIVVVSLCGIGSRILAKRLIDRHPQRRKMDRYAGAAVGLAQGAMLSLFLLWGALALEPVVRAQYIDEEQEWQGQAAPPPRSPVARYVLDFADQVHQSSLGGVARRTNPADGSELLSLAADFAAVSRHPEAMAELVNSPVMQKIEQMPSYQQAVEALRSDPELLPLIEGGSVSVDTIRAVLNSETVLQLFDQTTVVRDMAPLVPELTAAIRQAKARADSAPPRR